MRALGIEGTAHTISVGIVEEQGGRCRVLGQATKMHLPGAGKGIHPREAADHHAEHIGVLVEQALQKADVDPGTLDLVAFSRGPGMGPCLRTAATAARAIALRLGTPIVGVNHCVAHLEIGRGTTDAKDPILLYVSGANTQVIGEALGRYRVFGETLDIGVGNTLDKFARERGLPFPGGPEIEKLARGGKTLLPLPYTVKGMDVAFSGILTAAEQYAQQGTPVEDLAFSLQETLFAMLTEVTERAMAHAGKDEVLLGGGVARNKRLQAMVAEMAEARGARWFVPEPQLLTDNGAMIAWTGLVMHKAGVRHALEQTIVDQRFRTDDVEVVWR